MRVRKGTGLPVNAPHIGADEVYLDEATGKLYKRNASTGAVEEASVMTGAEIKAAYEAEADTNAFTDTDAAAVTAFKNEVLLKLYFGEIDGEATLTAARNLSGATVGLVRNSAGNYTLSVSGGYQFDGQVPSRPRLVYDIEQGAFRLVRIEESGSTARTITTYDLAGVASNVDSGEIELRIVVAAV